MAGDAASSYRRYRLGPWLLSDMARPLLPPRRQRRNPWVVKRKLSNDKRKRPAPDDWPQPRGTFREAMTLI